MSAGKVEIHIYQQPNYKKYGQGYRKLFTVMGVAGLTKNVSHHNWLSKIFCWNSPLKENLEQTINDSKFHICNSFFFENFISVSSIKLFYTCPHVSVDLIRDFFLIFRFSSRKSRNQQKLAKTFTHFTIQFHSKHLTQLINLNPLEIENNLLPCSL